MNPFSTSGRITTERCGGSRGRDAASDAVADGRQIGAVREIVLFSRLKSHLLSPCVLCPCLDALPGFRVQRLNGGFFALIVFERVHGPPVEAVGMAFSPCAFVVRI